MAVPDPELGVVSKTANDTYIPINPSPACLRTHDEALLIASFNTNQAIQEHEEEKCAAQERRDENILQVILLILTLVLLAVGAGVGVKVIFVRE